LTLDVGVPTMDKKVEHTCHSHKKAGITHTFGMLRFSENPLLIPTTIKDTDQKAEIINTTKRMVRKIPVESCSCLLSSLKKKIVISKVVLLLYRNYIQTCYALNKPSSGLANKN
jgi:hypothetical protein